MLGLGLGYRKEEFDAYGLHRGERAGRMEEGLQIIQGVLGNEPFSIAGRYFTMHDVSVYPKPIQQPLPLWVGARSVPAAERAARHDASLLLIDVGGNAKDTYKAYADLLLSRGRNPANYGVHGMIVDSFFISDDPEQTLAQIGPYVRWQMQAMNGWYEESATSGHDPALLRAMQDRRPGQGRVWDLSGFVVSSADTIVQRIEEKREEVPYTHLVWGGGNTTPSGYPPERMYPYLERFAKEVIPRFR